MRPLKWCSGLILAYVIFVLIFEAGYLGVLQPSFEEGGIPMLKLTTTDGRGETQTKMLARFETDGRLYVSAHHWTRGWYKQAVSNPEVHVEIGGISTKRVAIPVTGKEFQEVSATFEVPLRFRLLMGFPPPRNILRLDTILPN